MASFGRTRFHLRAHHQFVARHSTELLYLRAAPCPCGFERDPSQADPGCDACGGTGTVYSAPEPIWGMLLSATSEKRLVELGILAPGDAIFSPSPFETRSIADRDLLRSTWTADTPFEGELIERGSGEADQLVFPPTQAISCFSLGTDGSRVEYREGEDFILDEAGKSVRWVGNAPIAGDQYSIKYQHAWEWIAEVAPQPRAEVGSRLGQKVWLRRRVAG